MGETSPDRVASEPFTSHFPDLLEAVWSATPPLVGTFRGRFRWRRGSPGLVEAIEQRLAWQLGPGSISVDPARARSIARPPNGPGDRPCEILLYPAVSETGPPSPHDPRDPIYLSLFYAVGGAGPDPSLSERARAYFRVTEALDGYHDDLAHLYPHRSVRAIDLPMPGWMRQELRPTHANFCRILTA